MVESVMNNYQQKPILGCIADDFMEASDLASFLVNIGLKTLKIKRILLGSDRYVAIVVALITRTVDARDAVETSIPALRLLKGLGCRKFYFKYCSIFDSTSEGNIGPVIDEIFGALKLQSTIIFPALPVNCRTIRMGHIFVADYPLNKNLLKDHPLMPMQDSSVVRLIEAQGQCKTTYTH